MRFTTLCGGLCQTAHLLTAKEHQCSTIGMDESMREQKKRIRKPTKESILTRDNPVISGGGLWKMARES